ncbi:Flagellar hook-length control protein FliK [Rhodovulum sp. P5]|uniref:hypothetical protein n=1 Tax=Rhodovulum sp. P5 TaxID=1564506 RepID=UPI0009C2CEA6|nr:hypothetical protein [Rhodovulum sp. P5]ARE39407.1 Flagellar hook-length control protein FliK [Rhodovulum sp. P5]
MEGMNKLLVGLAVLAAAGIAFEAGNGGSDDKAETSTAPVAVATTAPAGGVGAGETALLGDGAARVFVSRVAADAARVAVNGFDTTTLTVGETAAVGDGGCSVTLDAVGAGKASFSYACSS